MNRSFIIVLVSLLVVASTACEGSGDSNGTEPSTEDTETSEIETDGADCSGELTYNADSERCTCGETADVRCPEGSTCMPDEGACAVEVTEDRCTEGTYWGPESDKKAFEDASESWGLEKVNPAQIRLSVTDINHDGWPDLLIRGKNRNSFGENGSRTVWLFENTGDGTFKDVTEESNFLKNRVVPNKSRKIRTVAWGDVDNDGDYDAYTGFVKSNPSGNVEESAEIMLNQGDGTFELGPVNNPVRRGGKQDGPFGATFVDYNRDGNLDLWVSQTNYSNGWRPKQDRLFRGNGDGTFEEVTEEVGLTTAGWQNLEDINRGEAHTIGWGSVACDLDNNGYPELLSSSYGRAPNHLFKSVVGEDGSITYENVSVQSGYAYDDNMDWTTNLNAQCYCKDNPEAEGCGDVPEPRMDCRFAPRLSAWQRNFSQNKQPFRLGGNSASTICADIDTDGQMDLLTTEITHQDVGPSSDQSEILYNTEDDQIKFERPGREATGLTRPRNVEPWNEGDQTAVVFDFDNDARPDIYIGDTDYPGTRGRLWHQTKDGTFEYVKPENGIDQKASHGSVVADFDRDGDLDVVVGHGDIRCRAGNHCYSDENNHNRIFENQIGEEGNWLQLDLTGGEGTNKAAIGAQVKVETQIGTQTQRVGGGHGQVGTQNDPVLHFGLGKDCEAKVTVRWPNKDLETQTFMLQTGYRYKLKQGEAPKPVE